MYDIANVDKKRWLNVFIQNAGFVRTAGPRFIIRHNGKNQFNNLFNKGNKDKIIKHEGTSDKAGERNLSKRHISRISPRLYQALGNGAAFYWGNWAWPFWQWNEIGDYLNTRCKFSETAHLRKIRKLV